jgi:hypothetical protein
MKFDVSYSGPAINDLSDPNVPNPDNRPRPNRTSLTGYPALRYRIDSSSAINASTGVRWFTPYQRITGGKAENPPGENSSEISNPSLGYDRTYAIGRSQMRSSVKGSYITSDYYETRGQVASLGLGQSIKYTPGTARLILGLALDLDYYFFNREYQEKWPDRKGGDGQISSYYLTYIPSVEYKLFDNFGIRGSVGWSYSNRRSEGSFWKWAEVEPTGRLGFGWAISREVFFSPYVSFYTKHPALNSTNLGFSTVFSIL